MTQETEKEWLPRWGESYTVLDCEEVHVYTDENKFNIALKEMRSEGWIGIDIQVQTEMSKVFFGEGETQPGMHPMNKVAFVLGKVRPEAVRFKRFTPAIELPRNQEYQKSPKPESRKVEYPVKWRKPCGAEYGPGGCGREVIRIIWSEGAKKVWYELDEKTEHKCPGPDRA